MRSLDRLKKLTLIGLVCIVLSVTVAAVASAQEEYPWPEEFWGTEESAFLFGFGLTMCIVIIAVPLIIAILACIWIYRDAEKRGKQGILWVILLILGSLFFSFIGLIAVIVIWLIVRPPIGGEKKAADTADRRCPNCGRVIPIDARTCPYCSKKFEE